MITIFVYKFL